MRKLGVGRLWGGSGLGGNCGGRVGTKKCLRRGFGADFEWGFESSYEGGPGVDFWRGLCWRIACGKPRRLGGGGLWRLGGLGFGGFCLFLAGIL